MEKTSENAYNAVMNMLKQCANQLYQMKHMFKHNCYDGFAAMAEYETMERWRYVNYIADYLLDMSIKPVLTAIPAPVSDYPSPNEALTAELNCLVSIVNALKSGMTQAVQTDPAELNMMSKLYKKIMKEHEEIKGIISRMNWAGGSMLGLDNYLYMKYEPKLKEHRDDNCHSPYKEYSGHSPCGSKY